MRVEQIRVGVILEEVLHDEEGVVAVLHPGPEIHFPTETPASGHVTALEQRRARTLEQFRRTRRGDLVGRIQPVQMRDVPMLVLGVVPVSIHSWS
jgi:hypothetical protein